MSSPTMAKAIDVASGTTLRGAWLAAAWFAWVAGVAGRGTGTTTEDMGPRATSRLQATTTNDG